MITVIGKKGIRATVIADSISKAGVRFITFEIEYPRLILAEFNTHRMLSKNSASSRAIPFLKMLEQLKGEPVRFGGANAGMQDSGEHRAFVGGWSPEDAWQNAKEDAVRWARKYQEAGYAKQIFNRFTEPFQMMKSVVSGTEWDNFFWLREDLAADPSIYELARVMHEAKDQSIPVELEAGEWHLPYVDTYRDDDGVLHYGDWVDSGWREQEGIVQEFDEFTLEDAIKVSCARSAAVSFRNVDYGLDKCKQVYERLVGDEKKHGSAMEHAATPMKEEYRPIGAVFELQISVNVPQIPETWEDGVTHMDRKRRLWSGNIRGFIQHRKLIPGENYEVEE